MTSDPAAYGITDPGAVKIFNELQTPAERRALAQEYLEWEHMMNGTIREQLEVAAAMDLKEDDDAWANYITTMCPGATDGTWDTFAGYFNDKDGRAHYEIVLSAIRGSSKQEEPQTSTPIEEPEIDDEVDEEVEPVTRELIEELLNNIQAGPVPEGKRQATIDRLLRIAEEARGDDPAQIFIKKEVKKFCDGEIVATFVFNEELWNAWKG